MWAHWSRLNLKFIISFSVCLCVFLVCVCARTHIAASTMENKKLLILASIRQPMADHSNKVTHVDKHLLYLTDNSFFFSSVQIIRKLSCLTSFLTLFVPGEEACYPGDQCDGSSRLPGVRGRGVTGSIHSSTLCLTWHISGTLLSHFIFIGGLLWYWYCEYCIWCLAKLINDQKLKKTIRQTNTYMLSTCERPVDKRKIHRSYQWNRWCGAQIHLLKLKPSTPFSLQENIWGVRLYKHLSMCDCVCLSPARSEAHRSRGRDQRVTEDDVWQHPSSPDHHCWTTSRRTSTVCLLHICPICLVADLSV